MAQSLQSLCKMGAKMGILKRMAQRALFLFYLFLWAGAITMYYGGYPQMSMCILLAALIVRLEVSYLN